MIPTWGAAFGANAIFNSAEFRADLTHSAVPDKAAPGTTGTFTRATTATWPNNDGYLVTGVAGEIGFVGARRVYNLLAGMSAKSEDLTSGWSADAATLFAGSITEDAANSAHQAYTNTAFPANASGTVIVSCEIKQSIGTRNISVGTGTGQYIFNPSTGEMVAAIGGNEISYGSESTTTVDGYWRVWVSVPYVALARPFFQMASGTSRSYQGDGASQVLIRKVQLEDVTAQTTQTAGEYVSVGALDYRSELNPLYLSLPGTAGHYASTPDSVANSITGDIDIRVKAALTDWVAPGAHNMLVSKLLTAGQYSYDWYVQTGSNFMMFRHSTDGTAVVSSPATAAVSFTDGTTGWVRVTRVSSTGAVTFFTSSDGTTWSQLGDLVSSASGEIFDGNTALSVGANATGASPLNGKIFSAQIYNTIGGTTPVVDFNPHRDATTPTGTITSSTTGEVWTINGASSVVRSDYYHGSFVDGVKCFPTDLSGNPIPSTTMLGYQAEGARTNLCLQSQTFDNAAWSANNVSLITSADQYVAPDGTTTMDKLTCGAGNSTHYTFIGGVAYTAAAHTASFYLRYVNHRWVSVRVNDTASNFHGSFDLLNGVAGAVSAGVTSKIEATGLANVYRVSITCTTILATNNLLIALNNSDNAGIDTWNAAGTEAIGAWGAQVELGSFASSYIATTTAAVTRDADVLTYSSAGNIDGTKGWCYAGTSGGQAGTNSAIIGSFDGGSGSVPVREWSGTLGFFDGTANRTGQAYSPSSASSKLAISWGGVSALSAVNGSVTSGITFDGEFQLLSVFGVGTQGSGTAVPNFDGNIGPIYIGQRQLSASELQAITA